MKLYLSGVVLLPTFAVLSLAQDASKTGLDTAVLTSSLSEVTRAPTCIQQCYRKYGGDFANCPLGEDKILECYCEWSSEEVPRETECVVEECGPDAYLDWGDIIDNMCYPVMFPSGIPTESGPIIPTESGPSIPTDNPNTKKSGAGVIGWSSGAAAGFFGSLVYLVRMIL